MEDHTHFLFAKWDQAQVRLVCQLIPLLCRYGAGLYGVDFPFGSGPKEVRVGWPSPNSRDNHILSVFEPKPAVLRWELRITPGCRFISHDGPLRLLKLERGKEHQPSQQSKGCIEVEGECLPFGCEEWIKEAFTYCRRLYGVG